MHAFSNVRDFLRVNTHLIRRAFAKRDLAGGREEIRASKERSRVGSDSLAGRFFQLSGECSFRRAECSKSIVHFLAGTAIGFNSIVTIMPNKAGTLIGWKRLIHMEVPCGSPES